MAFGFQSPTGNIRCAISASDTQTFGCETLNNGHAVIVESTGDAYRDDGYSMPAEPTLSYKWRWSSTFFSVLVEDHRCDVPQ